MIDYRGLTIDHVSFGNVSSDDLFEEREQAAFDFYERNKSRYKTAVDIGANIGVHTLLMAKQGWNVTAYEPDPQHFAELAKNIKGCGNVTAHKAAVYTRDGTADFTRVLHNGTANHLTGLRDAYGPTEKTRVKCVDITRAIDGADFCKIDAEGAEAEILCFVDPECDTEFLVEVGSKDAGRRIFTHFRQIRGMWRQRGREFSRVLDIYHMPERYQDGALFIGVRP